MKGQGLLRGTRLGRMFFTVRIKYNANEYLSNHTHKIKKNARIDHGQSLGAKAFVTYSRPIVFNAAVSKDPEVLFF